MSGYEASERCVASQAMWSAADRLTNKHTLISVTLDDLWPQLTRLISVACIGQLVDQLMLHCLNVGERLCFDCIDVCYESDRLPAKKWLGHRKTCAARQWNLRQHSFTASLERFEVSRWSRVHPLPGASFSTVMVEKGSVSIMANFEAISLTSLDEQRTNFWWKYFQDTALQDFPRRNSVLSSELVRRLLKLPFGALLYWPLRSRMREEYMRWRWFWGSRFS